MKRKNVISLFDYTGEAGRPWARNGYTVYCLDSQHGQIERREEFDGGGALVFHHADLSTGLAMHSAWIELMKPVFMFAFPPCTDLASSGARHFKSKAEKNPAYQAEAMALVLNAYKLCELGNCPYLIENPVGRVSTLWRKPDHIFDPCDYGGYLPANDNHPRWPEVIPARDAYRKRTCLWVGGGFVMPNHAEVEPISRTYAGKTGIKTFSPVSGLTGGKSLRTKNIRSATPRGFASAVYLTHGTDGGVCAA